MTACWHIALREYASFFRTSIGWVVIALYMLLMGIWVARAIIPGEPASLRAVFQTSQILLLFVAPAVSMRLLAEERRSGTIETLGTSPASDWAIAFGKYFGALCFLLTMLAPTGLFLILLEVIADPDYGPIASGYLGVVLLGMLYLSVGLLFSSFTQNQIVAFLGTLFFFLILLLATTIGATTLGEPWSEYLRILSLGARMDDFARGVIDTAHIVFFIALSFWFVSLTAISLEFRRWR